jgi:cystathionine beta-lyase
MHPATRLVHFDRCPGDPHRPTATPIYQTATFEQAQADVFGAYDYSRSGNPTRAVLERQLADLEGGCAGFAFASGMAAITAVGRLLRPGDRALLGTDLYGGTCRLFHELLEPLGVEIARVDTSDVRMLERALERPARLVFLESPSNPLHRVTDLRAAATLAHRAGALLAVDNTMMTPILQRPLELGADLVVHSATKFLGGHGDVTAGAVVARDAAVAERIGFVQNAEGTALGPFDAWLLLRGLKTLGVRIAQQQRGIARVAAFLATHRAVESIAWTGRDEHPGAEVHRAQAAGPGSVLAFTVHDAATAHRVVERTRLFATAVSFGGVGSSISLPLFMSHASIPAGAPRSDALSERLVRLSVGIEDPDDLVSDLARALAPDGDHRDGRKIAKAFSPTCAALPS